MAKTWIMYLFVLELNLAYIAMSRDIAIHGSISSQRAHTFLGRYKRGAALCLTDATYCENNLYNCQYNQESKREDYCVSSNPCHTGQTCYLIRCQPHYSAGCTNTLCERHNTYCANGGTCQLTSSGYTCSCVLGYDPTTECTTQINFCNSNPCKNGGVCNTHLNGYTCSCKPGYTGRICDTEINFCNSKPCENGGVCNPHFNGYTCICKPGYTGRNCETDINECSSFPCIHGNCTDLVNEYNCTCFPGYTGTNCHIDINECFSFPCIHGNCTDLVNGYTCSCNPGYTGILCEIDINECQSSPCPHGTCIDAVNGYMCKCQLFYTGRECKQVKVVPLLVSLALSTLVIIGIGFVAIFWIKKSEVDKTVPFPFQDKILGQSKRRFNSWKIQENFVG